MFFLFLCYIICLEGYDYAGTTLTISVENITSDGVKTTPFSTITYAIIKEGAKYIWNGAFSYCSSLTEISIPSTIQIIKGAFYFSGLSRLKIPENVNTIDTGYLVYGAYSFVEFEVDGFNTKFSSIDGVLYNKEQTMLMSFPPAKHTAKFPLTLSILGSWSFATTTIAFLSFPTSISQISYMTFVDSKTKNIEFAADCGLSIIPTDAFHQSLFTSFVCPKNVQSIQKEAFQITKIQSFTFAEGSVLQTIDTFAFRDCADLQTVHFPSTTTNIATSAFSGCSSLQSVVIDTDPADPAWIESDGFIYSKDFKTLLFSNTRDMSSMTLHANTESITDGILQRCPNLKTINPEPGAKLGVKDGVIYTGNYEEAIHAPGGLEEAEIDSRAKTISAYLFYNVANLRELTFAPGCCLEGVKHSAFKGCRMLKSIEIPDTCTLIDGNAFDSAGLTSIKLPQSLTGMGSYSFCSMPSLKEVDMSLSKITYLPNNAFASSGVETLVLGENIEIINERCFFGCSIVTLKVPNKVKTIYRIVFQNCKALTEVIFEAESQLTTLMSSAFSGCENLQRIKLPPKLSTLDGEVFTGCSSLTTVEWIPTPVLRSLASFLFRDCKNLRSFHVPASVTSVDAATFFGCESLSSITADPNGIFDSVKGVLYSKDHSTLYAYPAAKVSCTVLTEASTIRANAFYGAAGLQSLDFGQSKIETIHEYTFYMCSGLARIDIPSEVSTIKTQAFYSCEGLKEIKFADESKLKSVESSTFGGCTALESLYFGEGSILSKLGDRTFAECSALTTVILPSNLSTIGVYAFQGCTSLTNVTILGEALQAIPAGCFSGCTSLARFTFPASITSLGSAAFQNCTALLSVDIPESISGIGESAFDGCSHLQRIVIRGNLTSVGASAFSKCDSIQEMYYCGTTIVSQDSLFSGSNEFGLITLLSYPHDSFGGREAIRAMDRCLVFPTPIFTNSDHAMDSMSRLLVAALIFLDETEK